MHHNAVERRKYLSLYTSCSAPVWIVILISLVACTSPEATPVPTELHGATETSPGGVSSGSVFASATRTLSPLPTPALSSVAPTATRVPTVKPTPTEPPAQIWARIRPNFDKVYYSFRQAFVALQRVVPPADLNDERKPAANDGSWRRNLPGAANQLASSARDLETLASAREVSAIRVIDLSGLIGPLVTQAKLLVAACDGYVHDTTDWLSVNDEFTNVDDLTLNLASAVDQFERTLANSGGVAPANPAAPSASPGTWIDPAGRYSVALLPGWHVDEGGVDGSGKALYITTNDEVYLSVQVRPLDHKASDAADALKQTLAALPEGAYTFGPAESVSIGGVSGISLPFKQAGEAADNDAATGKIWVLDRGRLQYFVKAYAGGSDFRRADEVATIVASITFLK